MKKNVALAIMVLLLMSFSVHAHHPAASIVDEEIYSMIDEMVSDTPHATMVFDDDMGGGVTMTISGSIMAIEDLIFDGLLRNAAELDGDVSATIDFTDRRNAVVTIFQAE